MKFQDSAVNFHPLLAVLFITSSIDGLPTLGDGKVPKSQSVILGESVYETIEEIITSAINGIPLLTDDEIRLKMSQSLLKDESETSPEGADSDKTELSSAEESKMQTSGSPVIIVSPSIRKVITLSVAKNLAHYLPVRDDEQIPAWLTACLDTGTSSSPVSRTSTKTVENLSEKPKVDTVHERIKEASSTTYERMTTIVSGGTEKSFAEMVEKPSFPPTSQQKNSAIKPEFSSSQQENPMTTPYSFSDQQGQISAMNEQEFFNRQRKGPASASASSSTRDISSGKSHFRRPNKYTMIISSKIPKMNVIDVLRDNNINLKSFGVVNFHLLPSKSLLVSCVSQEMMQRLRDVILKSGQLNVSEKKTDLKYEVRLFPKKGTPEATIKDAVFHAFGEYPSEIIFIPYKGNQRGTDDLVVVLLLVSLTLYQKMEKNPKLTFGTLHYRLYTEIRLDRCDKCKLLGHREKFCQALTVRPWPGPLDDCIDCIEFNKRQRERYGDDARKFNDVKHRMGADNCPSKQYYINQYRRSREGNDRSDTT